MILEDHDAQLTGIEEALGNVSRTTKEVRKIHRAVETVQANTTMAADYWKIRNWLFLEMN